MSLFLLSVLQGEGVGEGGNFLYKEKYGCAAQIAPFSARKVY